MNSDQFGGGKEFVSAAAISQIVKESSSSLSGVSNISQIDRSDTVRLKSFSGIERV
jgi:hypothetical protein